MTLLEQDLLKRLENCDVFATAHRAAFAPTSRAVALFDELKTVISGLQAEQSKQMASGGGAIGSTRAKASILGELYRDELKIESTARQMTTLSEQEKGYFVRPVRRELEIVGAARSFIEKASPIWAKFEAYEIDVNLLTDMETDLADYDATYGAQQGDRQNRIDAGSQIDIFIERGGAVLDELRPIVKNKFSGQPAILAAWASASRYPERAKTPQPPAPPTA